MPLTVNIDALALLLLQVSISTLFAFWIVALALMWKRYHKPSDALGRTALMAGQLVVLVGSALGERRASALGWGGCAVMSWLCCAVLVTRCTAHCGRAAAGAGGFSTG